MNPAVLETEGLSKLYGALVVVDNVHFRLEAGARHALIGPNGAGKTTFVNLLAGRSVPTAGRIHLAGHDITNAPAERRVAMGLGRTFQINQLCKGLEAIENVALAIRERKGLGGRFWSPAGRDRASYEEAAALLERLALGDDMLRPAGKLSYGRQRLVELAMAVALQPRVLLLDEPAAGVPSLEGGVLLEALESLSEDMAVLIIEHDMDLVFRYARRITVLAQGKVLAEGTPTEIAADPVVRETYLGEDGHG